MNEERLLKFLNEAKPIDLQFDDYNQHSLRFWNQLGFSCRFLRALIIKITKTTPLKTFKFFFELENLICLKIENGFSFPLALCILKKIQSLQDLRFDVPSHELKFYNELRVNGIVMVRITNFVRESGNKVKRCEENTFQTKLIASGF